MTEQPRRQRSCKDHARYRGGCEDCNQQNRRYVIRRNLAGNPVMSQPAALTVQRLRELRALGYSRLHIAAEAGISANQVVHLSLGKCEWVQLRVFHGVERAYGRLRSLPGPDLRAANWAAKKGWLPPEPPLMPAAIDESYIDEIAVERAVAGDRVPLTRAESSEAWRRLEERGQLSLRDIARQLHTSEKTVSRWRSGESRPSTTRARRERSA